MGNRKIVLLIFLALFARVSVNSQPAFQKIYGNTGGFPNYETGYDVCQTIDGGYAIIGFNYISGAYLLKINPSGDTSWTKTYSGWLGYPNANSIKQTSDGGYVIAGYFASGNPDQGLIIKTDSLGNILWSKVFGGNYDDRIFCIQQTTDGGYIFTGYTGVSSAYNDYDVYIVKLNALGGLQWSKTFGDTDGNLGEHIEQTSDGGYIISGFSEDYSNFSNQYTFLLKIDSSGNLSWLKNFYSPNLFEFMGTGLPQNVEQTNDGGYILIGYLANQNNTATLLLKTDSVGMQQWAKTYSEISGGAVEELANGEYIVAGYMISSNEAVLLKLNSMGDTLWSKGYNGTSGNSTFALSVKSTADGGFVSCGQIKTPIDSGSIYLVKTDSLGNGICFNAIQNISDSAVNFNASTPAYLSSFLNYTSGISILVNSYGINITDLCFNGINEFPNKKSISIFPNPFNTSTTIQFNSQLKNGELEFYNLYGQGIRSIKNISSDRIEINREDLPNGIYFIRVTDENKIIATEKIIIAD